MGAITVVAVTRASRDLSLVSLLMAVKKLISIR